MGPCQSASHNLGCVSLKTFFHSIYGYDSLVNKEEAGHTPWGGPRLNAAAGKALSAAPLGFKVREGCAYREVYTIIQYCSIVWPGSQNTAYVT